MNESWTFCDDNQVLWETRELSWDLLIWVSGSFAVEFPGREHRFLEKMIQRQSGVYKKAEGTTGEAPSLRGSLGVTGLYSLRTCCSL